MSLLASAVELLAAIPAAIPDPDPITPPGTEGGVNALIGMARWGGLALAVVGIIVVAAKITINMRRGEAAAELGGLGFIGIAVVLIGAASSLVGFIAGA